MAGNKDENLLQGSLVVFSKKEKIWKKKTYKNSNPIFAGLQEDEEHRVERMVGPTKNYVFLSSLP